MNPSASTTAGRYLTFRLGDESYGVRVLAVREIIRLPAITRVPQLPAHVRGVLNLRGRVIPVIDLRQRFGLAATDDHDRTCIVVVQVNVVARGPLQMGLVVDSVEEVRSITAAEIADTPDFGCQVDTAFLLGLAKTKGAVTALLDLDSVLTAPQFESLPSLADAST